MALVSGPRGAAQARPAGPAPSVPGIPASLRGLVRRERLFELLGRGTERPVTLVTGPAGAGKTLLVASWLQGAALPGSVVWVSVERGERDATRFWRAVIDGLRASGATAASRDLEELTPAPGGAGREFVDRLSEGLRELTVPVVLVLDDLHQLAARDALAGLTALLADPPPALRLILLARRAPRLGLHRLRVAGGVTEIRAAKLAFTIEEAGELLSAAGVEVSGVALAGLYERTEGWAAGLRLAAISLAGRDDPEQFVSVFSGSERTVADYLLAEVLADQPPAVRRLLLRTSVLERVNGPLASLLSGQAGGEQLLQELEDANAFVTSVDPGRSWFRYHHLFADLLRSQLRRDTPGEVETLHRAAARWYAEHGFTVEAIRHAEAGEDWMYAADLLMEHWFSLLLDGQAATIHALLAALPVGLVRSDAELAALAAADRLAAGRLDDADACLALAERLAESVPDARRRRFEVTLAVARLVRARTRGDYEAAVAVAHAILTPAPGQSWADVVPNDDLRALALMNLGFAEFWSLRLDDAEAHLQEGLALARQIERPYVALGCLGPLAHLANMTPRPDVGEERSREAIELAHRHGWSEDPSAGVAYLALGGGLMSRGRLEEGEHWLERAERALRGLPDPEASVSLPFTRGVLRFAQARYGQAIECFRDAERPRAGLRAPHFLSTSARTWRLRALIHLGDTAPARSALTEAGDTAQRLAEWCNLAARLHLAEHDAQAAIEALNPVREGSAAVFHVSFEIEALVLEAAARDTLGQTAAAEQALERALDLAEPQAQVWTILTVPGARSLLERHPRHRTAHGALIAELLDRLAPTPTPRPADGLGPLSDRLTARERHVLRLLSTNLSAAEIASELILSVHTVKTHMRHIYAKLDVHRRTDAVERARLLGLLAPSPPGR